MNLYENERFEIWIATTEEPTNDHSYYLAATLHLQFEYEETPLVKLAVEVALFYCRQRLLEPVAADGSIIRWLDDDKYFGYQAPAFIRRIGVIR